MQRNEYIRKLVSHVESHDHVIDIVQYKMLGNIENHIITTLLFGWQQITGVTNSREIRKTNFKRHHSSAHLSNH